MNKNSKVIAAVVVVVLIAVGVFVMTSKDTPKDESVDSLKNNSESTVPANSASDTNAVSIKDFAFDAATTTIKVGTTVTWTNDDSTPHTVTADTASADAPDSQQLASGDTYSFTFKKAGTYKYHCTIHSGMQGTVVVTE